MSARLQSSQGPVEEGIASKLILVAVGRFQFLMGCWTDRSSCQASYPFVPFFVDLSSGATHNTDACFIRTSQGEGAERETRMSQLYITSSWKWHPVTFTVFYLLKILMQDPAHL